MGLQQRRYETLKLLDRSYHVKTNVIKISSANTFQHELAKFLLAWEAISDGKQIVTEAIFKNKKRADILVLDNNEAWEVLHSETKKQFSKKLDSYPVKVIPFKAEDVINIWRERI